jgi:hypothetical protein
VSHNNGSDPLCVSVHDLAPLLDAWIERYEASKGYDPNRDRGTNNLRQGSQVGMVKPLGGVECLTIQSGVGARRIWGIRTGKQKMVTLEIADKLLTAMDLAPNCYRDGTVPIVPNPQWTPERYQAWLEEQGRVCET